VTLSGPAIARTTRTIKDATTATVRAPLRAPTKRALERGRDVRARVTVAFRPAGARKAQTVRRTLTIHASRSARR
jgi:hypothetical protein